MNLKACTFERLAFISLGFGRGAQVGENFTFGNGIYYGARVDVCRIHFLFGTVQALGANYNRRSFEEDGTTFLDGEV